MARLDSKAFDFRYGLRTTPPAQRGFPNRGFDSFYDAVAEGKALRRRKGMVRLAHVSPTTGPYAGTFDSGGALAAVEFTGDVGAAVIWDLDGLPKWTLEVLSRCDDLSTTRPVFARIAAAPDVRIYQDSTSGGRVVAELIDTGANTLTLQVTGIAAQTVTAIQLVKHDADSFTLRVNGSEASGTLTSGALKSTDDVLRVGLDNGANRFDGVVDFVRLLAIARADQRDGWCRLHNPHARYVLADYPITADANAYCLDRSKFGRHAQVTGSLGTPAPLAVHPVPVQMIAPLRTKDNARKMAVVAGGRLYGARVR